MTTDGTREWRAAEAHAIILALHDDCGVSDGRIAEMCGCSRYAILQIRNGQPGYSGVRLLPRLRALAAARGLSDIPAEGMPDAAGYDTPPAIAEELLGSRFFTTQAYAPPAPHEPQPRPQAPRRAIAYNTTAGEESDTDGPGWHQLGPFRFRWGHVASASGPSSPSASRVPGASRRSPRTPRDGGRTLAEELAPLLERLNAQRTGPYDTGSTGLGAAIAPRVAPTPPQPPQPPQPQTARAPVYRGAPAGWDVRPIGEAIAGPVAVCAICGATQRTALAVLLVERVSGRRLVTCGAPGCVRSVATL